MNEVEKQEGKDGIPRIWISLDHNAVCRLIGGDSEAEIALRRGVVANFTKSFLKGIANEDLVKEAVLKVRQETKDYNEMISRIVKEEIYKHEKGPYLKDSTAETIRRKVWEEIDCAIKVQVDAVRNDLNEKVKKAFSKLRSDVQQYVDERLPDAQSELINELVKERLTVIASSRSKQTKASA